jgi:hypothetical protein
MKKNYFVIAAVFAVATYAVASTSLLIGNVSDVNGTEENSATTTIRKSVSSKDITDVTSNYLNNPSFENDDINKLSADATRTGAYVAKSVEGWTISGSYGVSDIMVDATTVTDNNFGDPGTPSNGSQMYYIRNAWATTTASILQTVALPAGKYKLSVDNKAVTNGSSTATLVAGTESVSITNVTSMPSEWATTEVEFELAEAASISIGVKINYINSSGLSLILDNFRLYSIPND